MATRPAAPVASRARGTMLIVLSSCSFGGSGPLARAAMSAGLSPQQVTSARIGFAALVLLVATATLKPRLLRVRLADMPVLIGYGLLAVAAVQLLYFVAVARLPVGIAMLLEYMSPVLVTLWVRFVRRTRLPRAVWPGIALAAVGLPLVAQVWQGATLDALGLLAGLGTAVGSASYFLLGERASASMHPVGMTTWGLVIGTTAISIICPLWTIPAALPSTDASLGQWHLPVWLVLVALALVSTVLAYLTGTAAMRHLPPAVMSVLALLEPVVAIIMAWALLGQAMTPIQLLGSAALLAGALVVQLGSGQPSVELNNPANHPARSLEH